MDDSINIKLSRDQARTVREQFAPYMESVCELRLQDRLHQSEQEQLQYKLIRCGLIEALRILDKKLLTASNNLSFKFSFCQAVALYVLLQQLPIQGKEIYLINLRSHITTILHRQILAV